MTATFVPAHQADCRYRVPNLLAGIDLVDLLELCGTTSATAAALGLSQPTVSRRYRMLARDLGLRRWGQAGPLPLLYGDTICLRLLRQACQWHRLEAGLLRLAANPWHGGLLDGLPCDRRLPLRFRPPKAWQRLLEAGVIDAALLSGLDLELEEPTRKAETGEARTWGMATLVPLAHWPLGLWLPPRAPQPPGRQDVVLLPPEAGAPGLTALARRRQWHRQHASPRCRSAAGWATWLLQEQRPGLASAGWARSLAPLLPDWQWWPLPDGEQEPIWLLLPTELKHQHQLLDDLPHRLRRQMDGLTPELQARGDR